MIVWGIVGALVMGAIVSVILIRMGWIAVIDHMTGEDDDEEER